MKRSAVCRSMIGFALLALGAGIAVAPSGAAGGKSTAKVSMATYKEIAIGAKYDDVKKMLGKGDRASSKDVPRPADADEEKALASALKKARPNLLFMWNSGTDRLIIGIETADTGDVVVFKGFFWKEKEAQKGVFAGK